MTPDQYEASIQKMKPRVFMSGKKVASILENKNTRTVVESNKASYGWAQDPRYGEIMTCHSPLIDEGVNRYTYVSASVEDLVKKAQAGTFTPRNAGDLHLPVRRV
jgi:4-hydroxybutyryl-CoA dehydratase/vinylacetyl-CoA-Delta-isomerase